MRVRLTDILLQGVELTKGPIIIYLKCVSLVSELKTNTEEESSSTYQWLDPTLPGSWESSLYNRTLTTSP